MKDLPLVPSDDHVIRLAHESDPIRAVVELVWNSIDGEADNVRVILRRSDMEAIEAVIIEDDGHGITSDEVGSTFGRIGGSWKALSEKSKNGKRSLHGKNGEGRLRAFALGSSVSWVSESANAAGAHETVTIEGSRDRGHVFRWDAIPSAATKSGTTFTALNEQERSLNALNADATLVKLRGHFAPVLLDDRKLTVTFDGATLDPKDEIERDTERAVPFGDGQNLQLRIIEWKSGQHRALYFGKDTEHFVHETSGTDFEAQFSYSAYLTWDGFDTESLSELGLGDMAEGRVGEIWQATREAIRDHFASRRLERRRDQIQQWKQSGVYPYKDEPKTEPEKAERAVFDVISSTLVPQISKRKDGAQLTLTLLRDAIRADPDNLTAILHEVVSLSEADRKTLTSLLSETTLSGIIRSANLVAGRHKFLGGLEHMLFDPNDSGEFNERDHLHKILERELWIFGESYHLMSSERGLTEMLRNHLKLEGLPTKGVEPVKRWTGKSGRTDLHLAAKFQEHDRIRHLVVELKAPDITATRMERSQVEDYIDAVLTNPAFASDKSVWEFILVVTDYDPMVENSIIGEDRELGLFLNPQKKPGRPLVRGYVRRWRDIIDENKRRLEFVTSSLEHDPSISEGLSYLREQYAELLPAAIAVGAEAGSEEARATTT